MILFHRAFAPASGRADWSLWGEGHGAAPVQMAGQAAALARRSKVAGAGANGAVALTRKKPGAQ